MASKAASKVASNAKAAARRAAKRAIPENYLQEQILQDEENAQFTTNEKNLNIFTRRAFGGTLRKISDDVGLSISTVRAIDDKMWLLLPSKTACDLLAREAARRTGGDLRIEKLAPRAAFALLIYLSSDVRNVAHKYGDVMRYGGRPDVSDEEIDWVNKVWSTAYPSERLRHD